MGLTSSAVAGTLFYLLKPMKLVIVDHRRSETYDRMCHLFGGDPNVAVVLDRRAAEDRRRAEHRATQERRVQERRQKITEFGPRGFIIIDVEDAAGT